MTETQQRFFLLLSRPLPFPNKVSLSSYDRVIANNTDLHWSIGIARSVSSHSTFPASWLYAIDFRPSDQSTLARPIFETRLVLKHELGASLLFVEKGRYISFVSLQILPNISPDELVKDQQIVDLYYCSDPGTGCNTKPVRYISIDNKIMEAYISG